VAKPKQILFLNLYAFSLTGGVEKVSKNFIYALHSLFEQKAWESFSMHDNTEDVDTRYTPLANYQAFSGKKKNHSLSIAFGLVYGNKLSFFHILIYY